MGWQMSISIMRVSWVGILVSLFMMSAGAFMSAEAYRSRLIDARFEMMETGAVGRVNVTAVVRNLSRDRGYVVAIVPPGTRQPVVLTRITDAANKGMKLSGPARLDANGQVRLPFQVVVSGRDRQAIPFVILILNADGVIIAADRKALFFESTGGRYKRGSYESVFLPKAESLRGVMEPKVRPIPIAYPPHAFLKSVKQIRFGDGVTPNIFFQGNRASGNVPHERKSEKQNVPAKDKHRNALASGWQELFGLKEARADGPFTVTGQLLYTTKSGGAAPAWNWTVQVTQVRGGASRLAAYASVTHTGRWSLTIDDSLLDRSLPIHVSYRPTNRFFHIVDREGVPPAAVEDARPISATGSGLDLGVALMNFSDAYWGLGDVYQAGILMWNGFVSTGINPEAAAPIRVYFPNTWYDCGDGTGDPWSCSSTDLRNIWLVAEYNDAYTVMHELGHSIQSKYWSGQPSGAGITHAGDLCYNPGLALSEGFADALAFFGSGLHFTPNPGELLEGGYDIETVADRSICLGQTNETRVAQALWDMMDASNDGRDQFYFGKDRPMTELAFGRPGRLVQIILGRRRDAVSDYLEDIRAGVDGPSNKNEINFILNDNSIMVPLPR